MFYKLAGNGYITAIGVGNSGVEITEAEYNEIAAAIASRPSDTAKSWHRLREDLTWEEYPAPEVPVSEDVDDAEAYSIIFGGAE